MGVGLRESSSGSKRSRRSTARANNTKKGAIRDVRSLLVEDNKRVQNTASDKVKSDSKKDKQNGLVESVSAVDVELEDFCVTEEPEKVVEPKKVTKQEKVTKSDKTFNLFGKKSLNTAKEEKSVDKVPRRQKVADDGQEHVIDNNNAKVQIRHRRVPLPTEKVEEDNEGIKFAFTSNMESNSANIKSSTFDLEAIKDIDDDAFDSIDLDDGLTFDDDGNLIRKTELEQLQKHLDKNIIEFKNDGFLLEEDSEEAKNDEEQKSDFSVDKVGSYTGFDYCSEYEEDNIESESTESKNSEESSECEEHLAEPEEESLNVIQDISIKHNVRNNGKAKRDILAILEDATSKYTASVLSQRAADTLDDFTVYYNVDYDVENGELVKPASGNSLYMPNSHIYRKFKSVNWDESQEARVGMNEVIEIDLGCSFALPEGYGVEINGVEDIDSKFGLMLVRPRQVLSKFEAALPISVKCVGVTNSSYVAKKQPIIKCKIIKL